MYQNHILFLWHANFFYLCCDGLRLFLSFTIVNNTAVNIGVQTSVQVSDFNSIFPEFLNHENNICQHKHIAHACSEKKVL